MMYMLPTNGGEAGVVLMAVLAGLTAADDAGADPVGEHGHRR